MERKGKDTAREGRETEMEKDVIGAELSAGEAEYFNLPSSDGNVSRSPAIVSPPFSRLRFYRFLQLRGVPRILSSLYLLRAASRSYTAFN